MQNTLAKTKDYTPVDFAWVNFTPEDIREFMVSVPARKKEAIENIKKIPDGERTFVNTIEALERAEWDARAVVLPLELMMNVSTRADMREAAKVASDSIQKELIGLAYDAELYRAIKSVAQKGEALLPEEKKLLDETARSYKRLGLDLPLATSEEVKKNFQELTELGTKFHKNINEWKDAIAVSREELEGMSESYIAGLKRDDAGNYLVTLQYPDLVPFFESAKSSTRRKELADKNAQKGGKENIALLERMVALRKKNAELLGYANYGDYRTEDRMAKSSANVDSFLKGLLPRVQKLITRDIAEISALKEKEEGDATIHYYDVAYWARAHKKATCDIDDDLLRPYFPLEKVIEGTFTLYGGLFGVTFERVEGFPLWHESVELYRVKDTTNAETLGYFFFDLYPREDKYSHAAVFNVVDGHIDVRDGAPVRVLPVGALVTNFPKPTPEHPSMLSHGEVETFLHEFGHCIHLMLSNTRYAAQSSFNVAWDFVEAPSQMLENWAWHDESLKLISGHFKTGEPLPAEIVANLQKSKLHFVGYDIMRQMVFALSDMKLHTTEGDNDPVVLFRDVLKEWIPIAPSPVSIFPASFGHLAGGYDAGYYGYLWSRVYAEDMFSRFEKEGILSEEVGRAYRENILEKGASLEETEMVKNFLGRESSNEAFLRSIGLER